jgi:hypothetical protein
MITGADVSPAARSSIFDCVAVMPQNATIAACGLIRAGPVLAQLPTPRIVGNTPCVVLLGPRLQSGSDFVGSSSMRAIISTGPSLPGLATRLLFSSLDYLGLARWQRRSWPRPAFDVSRVADAASLSTGNGRDGRGWTWPGHHPNWGKNQSCRGMFDRSRFLLPRTS